MVEKLVGEFGATDVEADRSVWVQGNSDHELEAIMLNKLMAYMGAAEQRSRRASAASTGGASGTPQSQLTTVGNGSQLQVYSDFPRTWRLVGIAMNRVGFTVEDRNRSAGAYYVRYNDPSREQPKEGVLSKMAFWKSSDKGVAQRYIIQALGQHQWRFFKRDTPFGQRFRGLDGGHHLSHVGDGAAQIEDLGAL
jgi:outer membrane protein assembly factor BamC